MLFLLSFVIFAIYTMIIIRQKKIRWVGWVLAALYFLVIVLFGSALQAVFNIEQSSQSFFLFLAFVYSVTPIVLGEIVGQTMGKRFK